MHDLEARLDRAITKAKRNLQGAICEVQLEHEPESAADDAIDRYAALVALRARISALSALFGDTGPYAQGREAGRLLNEATAEAERLLGEDA